MMWSEVDALRTVAPGLLTMNHLYETGWSSTVLDPTVARGVDRATDDVFNLPNGSSVDRALDHVSLKFLHIPCAVDLQVRTEFQDAAVRDEECAALARKEGELPFGGVGGGADEV